LGVCRENCSILTQFLQNGSTRECLNCSVGLSNCLECSIDGLKCSKCAPNLVINLLDNQCVDSCNDLGILNGDRASGTATCLPCNEYMPNCKLCSDKNTCLQCKSGFYFFQNQCSNPCREGYYGKEGSPNGNETCLECIFSVNFNCAACSFDNKTDSLRCDKCKNDLYLTVGATLEGNCVATCPDNNSLAVVTNPVRRCTPCEELLPLCGECNKEGTQCTKCKANASFIGNSSICSNNCSSGYVNNENRCFPCNEKVSNCKSCHLEDIAGVVCDSCYPNFFRNITNACVDKCPISTYSKETVSNGSSKCGNCSQDCAACLWYEGDETTKCNACFPNAVKKYLYTDDKYPQPRTCISDCNISGFVECKSKKCEDFYELANPYFAPEETFKCVECKSLFGGLCKTCNTTQCLSCFNDYIPDIKGQCSSYTPCLPKGYIYNETNSTNGFQYCKPCNETFPECNECGYNYKKELRCSNCQKPYTLYYNSTYPNGICLDVGNCSAFLNHTFYPLYLDKINPNNESCISCEYQVANCVNCEEFMTSMDWGIWKSPKCTKCIDYYGVASPPYSCFSCPGRCKSCKRTTNSRDVVYTDCLSCDDGYYLVADAADKYYCESLANCISPTRYLDKTGASPECKSCENLNDVIGCISCEISNITMKPECIGCSSNNFYNKLDCNCTANCTGLLPYSYGDKTKGLGRCISCEEGLGIKGCISCNQTKCLGCYDSKWFDNSSRACVSFCKLDVQFYFGSNKNGLGECKPCSFNIPGCLKCDELGSVCKQCDQNLFINEEYKCQACSNKDCLECDYDRNRKMEVCSRCNGSMVISSDEKTCLLNCTSNSLMFSLTNYGNGTDKCLSCSTVTPGCTYCSVSEVSKQAFCLGCGPNLFLNYSSGLCVKNCQADVEFIMALFGDNKGQCIPCKLRYSNCKYCHPRGINCTQCEYGYGNSIEGTKCSRCSSFNCEDCYLRISTDNVTPTTYVCNKCISGYVKNKYDACTDKCGPNEKTFPENPDICVYCGNYCMDCTIKGTCLKCEPNYFLESGKCTAVCSEGLYGNNSVCQPCSVGYEGCTKCTKSECLKCSEGFLFDEETKICLKNCKANQFQIDTSCRQCSNNLENCDTCVIQLAFECKSCKPPYIYSASQKKCIGCDSPPPNCRYCTLVDTDKVGCSQCNSGFKILRNLECVEACPSGFYIDNPLLTDGTAKCVFCNSKTGNCNQCNPNDGKCTECLKNSVLDSDFTCKPTCSLETYYPRAGQWCELCSTAIPNCRECSYDKEKNITLCTLCQYGSKTEIGYLTIDGGKTCTKCSIAFCADCSFSVAEKKEVCNRCIVSMFLSAQGQCIERCPAGSRQIDNQLGDYVVRSCKECRGDLSLKTDLCMNCDRFTCLTCIVGYYLDHASDQICKTCKDSVVKNCADCEAIANNEVKCRSCLSGFRISQNKCLPCSSNCSSCDETKCLTCTAANYLVMPQRTQCSPCRDLLLHKTIQIILDGRQATVCTFYIYPVSKQSISSPTFLQNLEQKSNILSLSNLCNDSLSSTQTFKGTIVWALSMSEEIIRADTPESIRKSLGKSNITEIDYNDPFGTRRGLGFLNQIQAPIRLDAKYNLQYFCENELGVSSSALAGQYEFTTPPGRNESTVLSFTVGKASLTTKEMNDLLCAVEKSLNLTGKRLVEDQQGNFE
jgi:hypothetical protein